MPRGTPCTMSSRGRRSTSLRATITGCTRSIATPVPSARSAARSSCRAATLASKRFRASLTVPGSVFMLTRAPEGNGNVLLQIDKDSGQPRARVDLGKEREPVYAVDDVAGMLFLRTASGTLVGYRL